MRSFLSLPLLLCVSSSFLAWAGLPACSSTSPSTGSVGASASSSGSGSSGSSSDGDATSCTTGVPLEGAAYDLTKSRFAFGSTPVPQDAGSLTRWVGSDGIVAIESNGSEMGSMDAFAPESGLPDWSTDTTKLTAHAVEYWESMGVASCQIAGTGIDGSVSGGGSVDGGTFQTTTQSIVTIQRAVQGVPVSESLAVARFDVNDQTTVESFYWPEIPADVVSAAIAFQSQLADPTALAAYKAKPPADAQGQGAVVIHHTSSFSTSPFQSAATYDVIETTPEDDGGDLSFDPNGNPVTTTW
ncbi:MAG TPA: hypothetical protein VIY73_22400 [Polyangiaceae bacterium]